MCQKVVHHASPCVAYVLENNGCRKNWAMSPFFCTPLFFWHLFLPSALYNGYIFPCSKVNEGECGVVAELILGKRIVSKSSLSLHTQNFKLKKKLFQISFLNSFINAIFAWNLCTYQCNAGGGGGGEAGHRVGI